MINWRPEYIALLNRLYWTHVLKRASLESYLEANRQIGRAAHVRPLTVERWIMGERLPTRAQGERLLRWAARVTFWEMDENKADTTFPWRQVTIAEKLSELIRDSKRGGG